MTHLAKCDTCRKWTEGSGRPEDFCQCKPHLHRTMDELSKKELHQFTEDWMKTFRCMFPVMSMADSDCLRDALKDLYEKGYRNGALRGE